MASDGEALVQALERGRDVAEFSIADMRSMLAFSTPRVAAYLDKLRGQLAEARADLVVSEDRVRSMVVMLEDVSERLDG